MQVKADGIETQLGNNGITLRIADNGGKSIGRLQVGRAKLLWFKGQDEHQRHAYRYGQIHRLAGRAIGI